MANQQAGDGFFAEARESLASAESDFEAQRYSSCVNRAYFACHQAAKGALWTTGLRVDDHRQVQTRFSGDLIIRRKLYSADLRDTLSRLMPTRHRADYEPETISAAEARRLLRIAQTFVNTVAGSEES